MATMVAQVFTAARMGLKDSSSEQQEKLGRVNANMVILCFSA